MTRVLGVDGCRGGWVVAVVEGDEVTWQRVTRFVDVLAAGGDAIGVDMPIGLPAYGRRDCDLAAKRLLGRAHSRVFLTPPRGVLHTTSYADAAGRHRELTGGAGLSVQTWHLLPKVREVDEVTSAADDARLAEMHPELSLMALAVSLGGAPVALESKKTAAGRQARIDLLSAWLPGAVDAPPGDDGLDALAVAWSAQRWLAGTARVLPDQPPLDEQHRPMRVVT